MPSSIDAGGKAWIAFATALGLAACAAFATGAGAAIDWQPALAVSEPWRGWTAAAVHYSALHLAANLAGCVLVGLLGVVARLPLRSTIAWLVAWPLTQFGLLLRPDLAHYGGLSGVLHAGVAVAAVHLLVRARPAPRHRPGPRRRRGREGAARDAVGIGAASSARLGHCRRAIRACHRPVGRGAHFGARRSTAPAVPCPSTAMTDRKLRLDSLAVGSVITCCFLWGLNQVAAKTAMPEVPALWQAAARSLGGAALVWLWACYRRIPLFERDATLPGGLLAGLLFAGEFFCVFTGLQYTNASRTVVFMYIAPFVVALGMPVVTRSEHLTRAQFAGLLLAFGGIAGAFSEGFTHGNADPRQWLGDALSVLGGVLWGATTLAVRGTALTRASAEKTLLYQLVVSAVLLTGAALITGTPLPTHVSRLAGGALAFQIVIVVFASYLVWFWMVRHYPATLLSSFTMLTPMFGLLLGAALLGEAITSRLLLALVAVAAGIVLVNRRPT